MKPTQLDLDAALARFGLSSFRPGQREVISAIVAGHDCMCVMPTGGGKSLCYQLPSIIRPGLTIVVSPLIALMKDQVDALCKKGIPAALINSTLSLGEQTQRLQDIAAGKYQLVYLAPERLRSNRFMDAIRATPIQLLAIDEAHCISQWGHDFRPDYARLGQFRKWLGDVQTVALTATATPRVREDIVEVLRLHRPKQFMSGFARPNLDFGVVQRQSDREKDEQLEQFLKREQGSGIIYAATRKRCDSLVEMLQEKLKLPVGAYHAGMVPEQRRAIQERFMRNELRIIVATNAFGMGIDKPDLRFVVHYNMPGSLEAYYQEAGRAGRDGRQSQCVLLYSFQDRYIQEFFIDNNYPPREVIESVYDFLLGRTEDPIELTHEEIRDALGLSVSAEAIGSSLQIIARTGVIERLETGGGLAMIRIDSELPTLVDLLPREATVKRKVLRAIERIVAQRRGEAVYVHPRWLTQELGMEREAMNRYLRELSKLKEVDYVPPFRGRAIHFLKRDVPFSQLEIDFAALNKRKEAEYERLNQVVRYAQTPRCRQAAILEYFGDTEAAECGHCDRCLGAHGWPHLAQRMRGGPVADSSVRGAASGGIAEISDDSQSPESPSHRPTTAAPPWEAEQHAAQKASPGAAQKAGQSAGRIAAAGDGDRTPPASLLPFLGEVLMAIDRTHGRLGKNLIGQFLCGSSNAKVQKLRLHRLSGFGLLDGLRQSDATALIDAFLQAGLLQQQEVNRNRPTVSLSEEVRRGSVNRQAILATIRLPESLAKRLETLTQRSPQQPAADRTTAGESAAAPAPS
ncbi:MAG: RecQ family ATP-dependent DNA helicase, partial [Aureliella sp.]